MTELNERLRQTYDEQPTVTTCVLEECTFRFEGTAADGREAVAAHRAEAHPDLDLSARRAQLTAGSKQQQQSGRQKWTRESAIEAIRRRAAELGHPPAQLEMRNAGCPSQVTLKGLFGSFANAIEAAGFPRPRRGVPAAPLRDAATAPERPSAAQEPPAEAPATAQPGTDGREAENAAGLEPPRRHRSPRLRSPLEQLGAGIEEALGRTLPDPTGVLVAKALLLGYCVGRDEQQLRDGEHLRWLARTIFTTS